MTPLRITKDHSAFSFTAAAAPVAEVDSGALVVLETSDEAYEKLSRGVPYQELHSQMNAVTGPLAVRGAEPGDALRVTLIEIGILRAWAAWIPGFGILGRRTETQQVAEVPLADGHLCIGRQLRVPLDPMVGCIGVAPRRGVGSAIGQCGPWGGNMDLREFRLGTSLCLPVFHPGALLSLGDVHAAMGAGEPCFVAIEASAEVMVRIDLEKGRRLDHPGCISRGDGLPRHGAKPVGGPEVRLRTGFRASDRRVRPSAVRGVHVCQCVHGMASGRAGMADGPRVCSASRCDFIGRWIRPLRESFRCRHSSIARPVHGPRVPRRGSAYRITRIVSLPSIIRPSRVRPVRTTSTSPAPATANAFVLTCTTRSGTPSPLTS